MKIRIREMREQKQMTIIHLEQLSGVSRAEISDIETGKKNPTLCTVCALAKALKVQPCDLFDCKDD